MYLLLGGGKQTPFLDKKKEKAGNTGFYVVPYPADTVLLEKPMTC